MDNYFILVLVCTMDLNLFIYFLFKEWSNGIVIMVEIHEIVLIVMVDDIFIMVMRLSLCLYLWLCLIFIVATAKDKEKEARGKGNQFRPLSGLVAASSYLVESEEPHGTIMLGNDEMQVLDVQELDDVGVTSNSGTGLQESNTGGEDPPYEPKRARARPSGPHQHC